MKLHFALVGNQNCGKSTLFNYLTGSNQHVGNFPGVTVQKKEGTILAVPDAGVIDLPGIYSLSPYTSEEIVTRDLLLYNKPDAIINVIDATNIERSLYLSLQLIELNIPMVIALNMMDELTVSGGSIDIKAMEDSLTVPVVPITANSGEGVGELLRRAVEVAQNQQLPQRLDFCSGPVHTAIHSIAHLIETKARRQNLPLRFTATKLIEGDSDFAKALQLSENECDIIGHFVTEMEQNLKTDKEAALADMRYAYIEDLCAQTVQKPKHTEAQLRSVKIDHYLTHKFYAIPIFIIIMGLVFWLTFDVIGAFLSDILSNIIDAVTASVANTLTVLDIAPPMHSLIIDGIFSGVGAVLSFLPTIVTLFFFLSMLEDSGYMARVAYGMFIAAFFPHSGGLVMLSLYLTGICVAILSGFLLNSLVFRGKPVPFVMELPAYRLPTARNIIMHMWEKAKDFLHKAFTVIFLVSIIVWFLQNFDVRFYMVDASDSVIASIGKLAAPIFAPLGFGSWQATTSLICGITAKEVVISTLSVLAVGNGGAPDLASLFSPLTAYTFLVFCLLYPPCVAALATIRRELNSDTGTLCLMGYELVVAWCVAFIVRQIGLMLGFA